MKTAAEFILGLPAKVKTDAIEGLETVFHFDISGAGGGAFTVSLKDQQVQAIEGFQGEPKCVVKASADNFMSVIRGETNPLMAIMMGKIKISNQGEMIKYAKIFGLM